MLKIIYLFCFTILLFYIVLINFLGIKNRSEYFEDSSNVKNNIITLNRILQSANSKENDENKRYELLSNINL